MSAVTILIASGKGGVGKSTAAVFLSRELAASGKKTLLIDADVLLGADDVLLGAAESVVMNWDDVLSGRCETGEGLTSVSENLSLAACPKALAEPVPDDAFVRLRDTWADDFDYILIDCPAGVDGDFRKAAAAAERAVIVATADEVSVACAAVASDELASMGMKYEDMRLLVNRFVKKAAKKSRLLNVDGAIDKSGVRLIGILPEDKRIPYMSVTGAGPKEDGAFMKAVGRVAKRVMGEHVLLKV